MKKQTRRSLANIGVVVATIGVLALGLFITYQIIAMGYHSSDGSTPSSSSSSSTSSSASSSAATSDASDSATSTVNPLTVRAQQIVGTMTLMADESLYNDSDKFNQCLTEYNALARKIPALEQEWLELSEKIEEGADE